MLISSPSAFKGLELLGVAEVTSAVSSVDILDLITSNHTSYLFDILAWRPATDGQDLWMRTSTNNSTFDSGGTHYGWSLNSRTALGHTSAPNGTASETSTSKIVLTTQAPVGAVGSGANETANGQVWLHNPLETGYTYISSNFIHGSQTANSPLACQGYGVRKSNADVDGVQFLSQSGNVTSVIIRTYGLKAS
jgi:hypothetical protein